MFDTPIIVSEHVVHEESGKPAAFQVTAPVTFGSGYWMFGYLELIIAHPETLEEVLKHVDKIDSS